jgi:hypothetical protein
VRPPPRSVPWVIRHLVTKYEWRHVKLISGVRAVVALWLVVLGTILCAYGYWWGLFLFVAAGLVGSLVYQMPRWKLALDAERDHQAAAVP